MTPALNAAILAAARKGWWEHEWLPRPSSTTVGILLLVIVALLGALIAIDILGTRRHRAAVRKRHWEIFNSITGMHGLNPAEIALLKRFADYQPEQNPVAVVNSPAEYDACVERELSALAARGAGEREIEELLTMISAVRHKLALDHLPQGQFLHSTREMLPNQEIKIRARSEGVEREFDSVVVTVTEKEITVTAPRLRGEIYHLGPGTEIGVSMVRQNDAIYNFTTRVLRTFLGRAPLVTIAHASDLERIQLRRYYRVNVNVPVSFTLLDRNEIARGGDDTEGAITAAMVGASDRSPGTLCNISGGGALVDVAGTLEKGDLLNFDIDIWNGKAENLTGEVVSVRPAAPDAKTEDASAKRTKTSAHLAFVGMSGNVRDKVVKYVFRRQLEKIRHARESAERHEQSDSRNS